MNIKTLKIFALPLLLAVTMHTPDRAYNLAELTALFRLRDAGHTILCVEHHKDLLNACLLYTSRCV